MVQVIGGYRDSAEAKATGMKEVTVTSSGDKTYLDVNAVLTTGDIEIGAVELKDGTTDARAPISATNGVLVNLGDNNDVTVTGSVNATCTATHLDIRHLNSTDDAVTVSASNLDIRDLSSTSDSVKVEGGNTNAVKIDCNSSDVTIDNTSIAVTQSTSPWNISGSVTATVDTSALATSANQGKFNGAVSGLATWKEADGKPRVSNTPYGYDVAEGNISGHTAWMKMGYNPSITTAEEDIWSYSGSYVFPTAEMSVELRSDDATADGDIGTQLFSGTCDATGSTTRMNKVGTDFSATAVAGDYVIIEKAGTTPEWGVITAVANGYIEFTGGLSSGGSCATARTYNILDSSAATGAMAVIIDYLDSTYAQKYEIIILNTTTQVASVNSNFYRINGMRVIAVGSKATATNSPLGNLELRKATVASPLYTYMTKGYTRARNQQYAVPLGKTLYITQVNIASTDIAKACRVFIRINTETTSGFKANPLVFYTISETMLVGGALSVTFEIPLKVTAKTEIRVSAIGLAGHSGAVTSVLRGWLE